MIVKNLNKEKNTVTFDVELDAAEFEKFVNGAYLKNRAKIMVPGFRKGKAPRMVIEGMYGAEVFYEDAFDEAANDAYGFGVEQEKLHTVGRPAMLDATVTESKGALLSFRTDVWPEVELGEYKGLKAEKEACEVSDEEIAEELERMRKQNSRLVTVERAAENGDTVNIDYCGKLNGVAFDGGTAEGQNLVLGSNSFVPGFESGLVGIKAGEERDLDITFPENYAKDLAGKAVVFHVKCNEVKFEELPELDDEFAKDNDFDTLDLLKADIKAKKLEGKQKAADNAVEDELVDQAVENMKVELPESMVEERMDAMMREYAQYLAGQGIRLEDYLQMMGGDVNAFRESTRETALKQTRTEVLLTAVADAEKIEITEDDLNAEYEKMAEAYSMKVEDVKQAINPNGLKGDLLRQKAIDVIVKSAVVKEAKAKKAAAKKPAAKKAEAKEEAPAEEKKPAKKPAAKKTAAKAEEAPAEAKKAAPKKTAAKKVEPAADEEPKAKKPAAKKTAKKAEEKAE